MPKRNKKEEKRENKADIGGSTKNEMTRSRCALRRIFMSRKPREGCFISDEGPDLWEDGNDKEPLSASVREYSGRIIQKKIKDGGPDNGDDLREDKELLSALDQDHSDHNIQKKIEILSQQYTHFRRTRGDSSCFYRAFLFSYLENLGKLQDRKAEVTRVMQHMATSKTSFCRLIWDKACFSNAEEYFPSFMNEFNDLVNLAANGSSPDERFKSCLKAMSKPTIIVLLRLLAETDIRTRGEEYKSLYPENFDAIPYCCNEVRPMDAQASTLAIRALTYALGIPLRIETVDRDLTDQIAEVKCLDIFPRSELGKGPYPAVLTIWSSITPPTPQQMGRCDLLSSDRTPLLTLMCVRYPRRWYILYR